MSVVGNNIFHAIEIEACLEGIGKVACLVSWRL